MVWGGGLCFSEVIRDGEVTAAFIVSFYEIFRCWLKRWLILVLWLFNLKYLIIHLNRT